MTRRRLTDFAIRAIKPKAKYFEVTDASGLRLGIQPKTGSKSFLTRYRRLGDGRPAKLTHETGSLAEARVAHAETLRLLATGVDPGADKQRVRAEARQLEADRRADTLDKHVRAFLDFQVRRVRKASWEQQRHVLCDIVLPAWGPSRVVSDIRRRDVIELIEQVAIDRPIMANRAAAVLHRFLGWLTERDVLAANPCTGVKRPSVERSRDRVLTDKEIQALWRALDAVGGPATAAAKAMLLTGQRRGEVAAMRRDEIDGNTWLLPPERTKNGRAHGVPLSRQVRELIAQQPVLEGCPFVFTAGARPAANFSRVKIETDAVMKPEKRWTWHDLRRTCASGMQRLGVRAEVIERCLNHASGVYRSVAGIYQRDPLIEETRDALQRWSDFVENAVKGEAEPGKVVRLRG